MVFQYQSGSDQNAHFFRSVMFEGDYGYRPAISPTMQSLGIQADPCSGLARGFAKPQHPRTLTKR